MTRATELTMTSDEIAWVAGLFEGEGCIGIYGYDIRLVVDMTDEDVMRRLYATVCVGSLSGPLARPDTKTSARKPAWRWLACGEDATALLSLLLPQLGERRSAKAAEALAARGAWLVESTQEKNCARCGTAFTPNLRARKQHLYCGGACKQRALRSRKAVLA